jgi:hypothetical protein
MKLGKLAIGIGLAALVYAGCSSAPTAFEKKFYNIDTLTNAVVVSTTNNIFKTNVVTKDVFTTNVVNDITHITITPTRDVVVLQDAIITYQTNLQVQYTYTANTNASTVSQVGGAIAAPFGLGGLVSTALTGLFGIWAAIRSRKKGQVAAGLTQGIEVFSEVLKTTPQGQELDTKAKTWLQNHQVQTSTDMEVLELLKLVDNQEARDVAAKIQNEIANRQK